MSVWSNYKYKTDLKLVHFPRVWIGMDTLQPLTSTSTQGGNYSTFSFKYPSPHLSPDSGLGTINEEIVLNQWRKNSWGLSLYPVLWPTVGHSDCSWNACWRARACRGSTPLAHCCRGSLQGKSEYIPGGHSDVRGEMGMAPILLLLLFTRDPSASAHFCIRGSLPGVGRVWIRCPGIVIFSEVSWSYKRLQLYPSLIYTQWAFKLAFICARSNEIVPVKEQIQLPESPILPNLKKSISLEKEINVWISVWKLPVYAFRHNTQSCHPSVTQLGAIYLYNPKDKIWKMEQETGKRTRRRKFCTVSLLPKVSNDTPL